MRDETNDEPIEGPTYEARDTFGDIPTHEVTGRTGTGLLAAFLLGLVTTLVTVLTWQSVSGGESPAPSSPPVAESASTDATLAGQAEGTDEPGSPAGTPVAHAATRLMRCVTADRELTDALEEARPALDQWSVHVGAMNKLVVGEITLQQASAFWNSTRRGAARRVGEFRKVMADLRANGLDCPGPHYLAPGARSLAPCARRVGAEAQALGAARTAMATWEHHIHDMEMLRSGDLSPQDATAMWLSMWQQGMRDLDAYAADANDVTKQEPCSPGAAAR